MTETPLQAEARARARDKAREWIAAHPRQDYRAARAAGARDLCRTCHHSRWHPERQRLACKHHTPPPWAYYAPAVPTCHNHQREPGSDDE